MTDEESLGIKKGKPAWIQLQSNFRLPMEMITARFLLWLAVTRTIHGKEQRIIVAGDADFLTTAAMD